MDIYCKLFSLIKQEEETLKMKGIWKIIFLTHTLICWFFRESIEILYFLEYINENKCTFFSTEKLFTIAALMSSKHHGNKCIQEYSHYSFSSSNHIRNSQRLRAGRSAHAAPHYLSNLGVQSNQVNTEMNLLLSHFFHLFGQRASFFFQ